jgi:photoactive yellow protein
MADVERDLYSFLRSKNVLSPDADAEETEDAPRPDDDPSGESKPDAPDPSSDATEDSRALPQFDDARIGEKLRRLQVDALNALDFGVVVLDDDGVVQFYNRYESELSGVDPEDAVGRNFFTNLAPCSNNRIFLGRFRNGVESGELDERFTYTFTYKMRPTLVDIRLYRDDDGTNWLLVKKR